MYLASPLSVHAGITPPPSPRARCCVAVFQLSFIMFSQVMVHMMVEACLVGNSTDYRVQLVHILVRWARSVSRLVHRGAKLSHQALHLVSVEHRRNNENIMSRLRGCSSTLVLCL